MPKYQVIPPEDVRGMRPEAANWFGFSFAGPEVEMLIGYIDLRQFLATNPSDEKSVQKLRPELTHRVHMSVTGLLQLKHQVDEVFALLKKSGLDPEAESEPK